MVFYVYRDRIEVSSRLLISSLLVLILVTMASHLKALPLLLPVFGAYVFFWLAFLPSVPLHRWGNVGDFSYGLYLYAFPVQQLLVYWAGGFLNPWTLFMLSFPIVAILAILSWHLIEKRFLARNLNTTPDSLVVCEAGGVVKVIRNSAGSLHSI